jgi:hypothetical protein
MTFRSFTDRCRHSESSSYFLYGSKASYAHSAYGLQRQGICALRRLGDALPRIPTIPVVPTGFTELDALLTIGGVPRGGLTELLIPIRVPTYNFAGG